jgi:hypothetical protein
MNIKGIGQVWYEWNERTVLLMTGIRDKHE